MLVAAGFVHRVKTHHPVLRDPGLQPRVHVDLDSRPEGFHLLLVLRRAGLQTLLLAKSPIVVLVLGDVLGDFCH